MDLDFDGKAEDLVTMQQGGCMGGSARTLPLNGKLFSKDWDSGLLEKPFYFDGRGFMLSRNGINAFAVLEPQKSGYRSGAYHWGKVTLLTVCKLQGE